MATYTSSILKIGLINSGMFDTLSLNFDVKAVHLVGANNVGKTSLISLIQFLFFPHIKEMTFIKSSGESMNFYFRPEGSYMLFEVRTITGSIRTVGIYGTGESDSRINFAFNGPFDLNDFLSDDKIPIQLKDVQSRFFDRDFVRFDTFERYEEALLGQHTSGKYNVPMFNLSKTNYRLLRKLMQGLLRLDRIDSGDVQGLIIQIVEKGAIKTSFNLAQDFEQKYRHINRLRIELQDIESLKPVMERYQDIVLKIREKEERRKQHAERLYHLSRVYLDLLEAEKKKLAEEFDGLEQKIEKLGRTKQSLTERRQTKVSTLKDMEAVKCRFETLNAACRDYSEELIKNEKDRLTHASVDLQNALSTIRSKDFSKLKRQLNAALRDHKSALRQRQTRTLQQLWTEAGFDEDHRILLNFLIANEVSSLDASQAIDDEAAFIKAASRTIQYLDPDGTFKGFGLNIPRTVWFVAEEDQESLEDRCDRLHRQIEQLRAEMELSENADIKAQERIQIDKAIEQKEAILKNIEERKELIVKWKSPQDLEATYRKLADDAKRLGRAIRQKEAMSKELRKKQNVTYTRLKTAEQKLKQVSWAHDQLEHFDSPVSENLASLPLEALDSEYSQVFKKLDDIKKELIRLQRELNEPKYELEARYDRSGADIDFTEWLERKSNLAQEIQELEVQLQRQYDDIFTLVKAKLSKITQAYQSVEEQVAGLNKTIRNVRISNIEQIGVTLEKTDLLEAIDQSIPGQLDLFSSQAKPVSLQDAYERVDAYFNQIKKYGNEINLKDMFRLKFSVQFNYQPKPVERYEIHRFESNGTETGVKIVIYLGLIGLLQGRKNVVSTRIPFFLDEVGSIDSENLSQLISYCGHYNFLPIFASPEVRKDISHNYLFRRNGSRSYLTNLIRINPKPSQSFQNETS
jgi:hypothetical protein